MMFSVSSGLAQRSTVGVCDLIVALTRATEELFQSVEHKLGCQNFSFYVEIVEIRNVDDNSLKRGSLDALFAGEHCQ